ncbi:MAG: 4Fe-4S binding protein [Thermoguttaceae bacterium]|jgi:formate hydrogenlyase subunit 6/NADH:ubiquinone oxidoreductase subunit I
MCYRFLRVLRILIAVFVLTATVLFFVDLSGYTLELPTRVAKLIWKENAEAHVDQLAFLNWISAIPKIQFIPALLAGSWIAFAVLFIATRTFGRVYCSIICPLGILQDVFSFFGRHVVRFFSRVPLPKTATKAAEGAKKPAKPIKRRRPPLRNYKYMENPRAVRNAFLILALASTFIGGAYFALLEPYSIFGRISVNVFKPIVTVANNALFKFYEARDVYDKFYYVTLRPESIGALVTGVVSFFVVLIFAGGWGRLYCNSVCPVGTILGALACRSRLGTQIDKEKCIKCGMCAKRCKSSCIDTKNMTVDATRCVVCFDCFSACKVDALFYGPRRRAPMTDEDAKKEVAEQEQKERLEAEKATVLRELEGFDRGKRDFIALSLAATTAAITSVALGDDPSSSAASNDAPIPLPADPEKPDDYGLTPYKRQRTSVPPGAKSRHNFERRCVGCHLCVTHCPQHVIKPCGLENGLKGFMQPRLDFTHGFCNYDCTICGEVCPTRAIKPLELEKKRRVQTGQVVFILENCIVYAQETSCGACSEHCPTQALRMVPYKGTLTIPEPDLELCVGCGGCEFICPARPFRAVYIEGLDVHGKAREIERIDAEPVDLDDIDFGF